ncbi:hypothetical protein AKJ09_03599 [Labilithrix luteola]|uniref:FecR protein domain-containing protein n=1 Tax=Labilithrix luteola TaxID=1391654 RepID=A0A0K1PTS6_9BACT|nr:FecR domain-containing protein [Labilithrix luteola]AKU96935.1 hypothetical protein AKJ09_03599 [Labilithrix luteola]
MTEHDDLREAPLDRVVQEAKDAYLPGAVDFDAIEASMMKRIEAEQAPLVEDLRASSLRTRLMRGGALALAAAAAVAIVVRREAVSSVPESAVAESLLVDTNHAAPSEAIAGALRATEGTGDVRVAGESASIGQVLRAGDVLEVDGSRAVLERPRKVSWVLERAHPELESAAEARVARARVKSAGEPLVLGLEEGAIEAQVTPVPQGEAFAVDVASGSALVRVAVHGTHLRVTRTNGRVVVDLTEGVVSIGRPPRTGSTYGTLVTAPAHVEFDIADLDGSLRVDHTPDRVRTALAIAHPDLVAAAPRATAVATTAARDSNAVVEPSEPQDSPSPPVAAPTAAKPSTPHAEGVTASPSVPKGTSRREAVAAAVRECAAGKRRAADVRVTVTSSLHLKVRANGEIESAQFDPPLMPEIQSCAASVIYKLKLDESGSVSVPIEFSY